MPHPRFTQRALRILLLALACFFGGILFERERQRYDDEAAAKAKAAHRPVQPPTNLSNIPHPFPPPDTSGMPAWFREPFSDGKLRH